MLKDFSLWEVVVFILAKQPIKEEYLLDGQLEKLLNVTQLLK